MFKEESRIHFGQRADGLSRRGLYSLSLTPRINVCIWLRVCFFWLLLAQLSFWQAVPLFVAKSESSWKWML